MILEMEEQSLPSRERGLKWIKKSRYEVTDIMSLPSRERGLKSKDNDELLEHVQSLPSRERGLKLYNGGQHVRSV